MRVWRKRDKNRWRGEEEEEEEGTAAGTDQPGETKRKRSEETLEQTEGGARAAPWNQTTADSIGVTAEAQSLPKTKMAATIPNPNILDWNAAVLP